MTSSADGGMIRPTGVKLLTAPPAIKQQRVIKTRTAPPAIKVRSFQ